MELHELLAFVDECDVGDTESHQCSASTDTPYTHHPPLYSDIESNSEIAPKKFQRPETKEIAALQSQAAALTLELEEIRQSRSHGSALVLTAPSHWKTEADRQSRLRAAALKENEQLKAKVQGHRQNAKRVAKILKRTAADKVLEMVLRCEREAELRVQKMMLNAFDEFDHAFTQTDAILADAEMTKLPSFCFDAWIRDQGKKRGFFVELRRRLTVARDLDTTSEAYWRFSPLNSSNNQFLFEQTSSYVNEMKGLTFSFHSREGSSQTRFHGHYLLRRYTTKERVIIVWKMLVEADGPLDSLQLQVSGRGWAVIQGPSTKNNLASSASILATNIQAVARFYPESKLGVVLTPDQINDDADLRALVDFVTYAGKGYAEFPTQMALQH